MGKFEVSNLDLSWSPEKNLDYDNDTGFAIHILMGERSRQKLNIFSISICIARPHKRIRTTSSYELLQACNKPFTSCSQACCKLAKVWLAYAWLAF